MTVSLALPSLGQASFKGWDRCSLRGRSSVYKQGGSHVGQSSLETYPQLPMSVVTGFLGLGCRKKKTWAERSELAEAQAVCR